MVWCYVCVCCESRFFVEMAGPGICVLWADGYLRILGVPSVQSCCTLSMSHINTFLGGVVGPGLVSTSPAFTRSRASHLVGPHGQLAQKR